MFEIHFEMISLFHSPLEMVPKFNSNCIRHEGATRHKEAIPMSTCIGEAGERTDKVRFHPLTTKLIAGSFFKFAILKDENNYDEAQRLSNC